MKKMKLAHFLILVLGFSLSACSAGGGNATLPTDPPVTETAQAVQPTSTSLPPTATTEPVTQENALTIAWSKINGAQSVTAHTIENLNSSDKSHVFEETCYLDAANQIWLETTQSSIDLLNAGLFGNLYIGGYLYAKDATDVYKPQQQADWQVRCVPEIRVLEITKADLQSGTANFLGEETINDVNTYKYEIILPVELLPNQEDAFMKGAPEVYAYVDSQNGDMVKFSRSFMQLTTYAYNEYQIDTEYSDWNSTTVNLPEYAEAQSTALQTYSGKVSEYITFQFPIIYKLNEYSNPALGTLSLETPTGAMLHWADMTEWNFDPPDSDDETHSAICQAYAKEAVLPEEQRTNPSASIAETNWINTEKLGFCKIVVSSEGMKSLYFFNAPLDSILQKSLFDRKISSHATFVLSLRGKNGAAVDDQFAEVINSLAFK
jgi:hypothetical protein